MAGTKLHIVSCFSLFALLVAPFAWQLTRVQRVDLPVDRIHALSWNASRFAQPERHVLQLYYINSKPEQLLKSRSPRIAYRAQQLQLSVDTIEQLSALPNGRLDDALLGLLPEQGGAFSVFVLCSNEGDRSKEIVVGSHRHAWTHGCTVDHGALEELAQNHVFPLESAADRSRARVAVKYRLQFTLLKERGDAAWTWDFEQLRRQYIGPVLQKVASLAQFTVEDQAIHYARIAKEIHRDAATNIHYVLAEDLQHFKSTNDFLASSVLADREQVLHFMAAVPAEEHAPLAIKSASAGYHLATAFEIPSWGVVAIANPLASQEKELQRVMGHFVSELRALLGLPSFARRQVATEGSLLTFLPSTKDGVAQWEVDAVARHLLRRHVRGSIETLQSIVKLVVDMPQMSVLDRVAQRVTHALELVESILCVDSASDSAQCDSLLDATKAAELLVRARDAVDEADAAYYDHTMIRQLYFPQEQMLGVFAPLLAPLLLPFFVGWIRELKQLKAKRKATLEKQA